MSDATSPTVQSGGITDFPPARRFASARYGWGLARDMAGEQPRLFWSSLVLSIPLGLALAINWLQMPSIGTDGNVVNGITRDFLVLAKGIVVLPIGYGALQRLLLGETRDCWFWNAPVWRHGSFLCLSLALTITGSLANEVNQWFGYNKYAIFLTLPISFSTWYYTTKLQFLAAAIVVRAPERGFRQALKESDGHFWNLVMGQICASLPLFVLAGLCLMLNSYMQHLADSGDIPAVPGGQYFAFNLFVLQGLFLVPLEVAWMTVLAAFYYREKRHVAVF